MFTSFTVTPTFNGHEVMLEWSVKPQGAAGNFLVQRGINGRDWQTVNTPGEQGITMYLDNPVLRGKNDVPHYRVILQLDGARHDSPQLSAHHAMTAAEYAGFRTMLWHEDLAMRTGDGVDVWLCRPKQSGELADGIDSQTGQVIGGSRNSTSFGQRYEGGFERPVLTRMRLMKTPDDVTKYNEGGAGKDTDDTAHVRMIAVPLPRKHDMVVVRGNNERYTYHAGQVHRFKGVIPLTVHAALAKLNQNDPRYAYNTDNHPE